MKPKKILIINGSPRIGQTKKAVDRFVGKLGAGYEYEIVNLRELDLKLCVGCAACLSRGEEFCPLADDRNLLLRKMDEADGIVFATPNFALHVTNLMKNFFDRHAFVFHRPRFFKKVFTGIITQGVYGGVNIDKYFDTTVGFWGGIYVPGAVITLVSGAYNPAKTWNTSEEAQIEKKLSRLAARFTGMLDKKDFPGPSLHRVTTFRFIRSAHKYAGEDNKDFHHFQDEGWFDSEYFYPVKLGLFKRAVGRAADLFAKKVLFKK